METKMEAIKAILESLNPDSAEYLLAFISRFQTLRRLMIEDIVEAVKVQNRRSRDMISYRMMDGHWTPNSTFIPDPFPDFDNMTDEELFRCHKRMTEIMSMPYA